jgi:hypothetical protein
MRARWRTSYPRCRGEAADPELAVPDARTAVVVAVSYATPGNPRSNEGVGADSAIFAARTAGVIGWATWSRRSGIQ